MRRNRRRIPKKYMIIQKLIGVLLLLLISVIVVILTIRWNDPESMECSILFITVPLGLCLIFSKELIVTI